MYQFWQHYVAPVIWAQINKIQVFISTQLQLNIV